MNLWRASNNTVCDPDKRETVSFLKTVAIPSRAKVAQQRLGD